MRELCYGRYYCPCIGFMSFWLARSIGRSSCGGQELLDGTPKSVPTGIPCAIRRYSSKDDWTSPISHALAPQGPTALKGPSVGPPGPTIWILGELGK